MSCYTPMEYSGQAHTWPSILAVNGEAERDPTVTERAYIGLFKRRQLAHQGKRKREAWNDGNVFPLVS